MPVLIAVTFWAISHKVMICSDLSIKDDSPIPPGLIINLADYDFSK